MTPIVVKLPIRTVSEANSHEHWRKRAKRAKRQRHAAKAGTWAGAAKFAPFRAVAFDNGELICRANIVPVVVIITRIAPRDLDSDNLAGSQKHVRDGIADALGIDDRDPRVEWLYAQRRGAPKEYAVEIEIRAKEGVG